MTKARHTRLSSGRLALYGMPGLPLAAVTLPVYIYLPTFYAVDIGLGLATVGAIFLLARLWDVITDPVIGLLSDRTTKQLGFIGRFGRRKPWIAFGALLTSLGFFAIMTPAMDASATYLTISAVALYLGWTMINLPYAAWGAELSTDYQERTRVTSWREGFVVAGTVIAIATPALMGEGDTSEGYGMAQGLAFLGVMVAIALPLSVIPALFALPDETNFQGTRFGTGEARPQTHHSIKELWQALISNRPFLRLVSAWMLNGIANGLPASLFLLFTTEKLALSDQAGPLLLLYFMAAILGLPFWLWLGRRVSKHRLWCGAMIWACLWFMIAPVLGEGDFIGFLLVCLATGFALGADLTLPSSMQADVIDLDEATYGTRRAGVFFSLWSMAQKLSLALAVALAFFILEAVGLDPQGASASVAEATSSAQQGPSSIALVTLSVLYAIAPIFFKLLAVYLMWSHPLDQDRQTTLRQRISH